MDGAVPHHLLTHTDSPSLSMEPRTLVVRATPFPSLSASCHFVREPPQTEAGLQPTSSLRDEKRSNEGWKNLVTHPYSPERTTNTNVGRLSKRKGCVITGTSYLTTIAAS